MIKKLTATCVSAAMVMAPFNSLAAEASQPAKLAPVAGLEEAAKVRQALDEFIQAYELGNINLIRSLLDPALIGYQRLIDGMVQDNNRLKQLRLHLKDTQVLAGPDVAVIQTNWEKRFLDVVGMRPGLYTGHSMLLMHRDQNQWRLAAFGGDNPFSSQSGVLGQIIVTNLGIPAAPSIRIEVIDPDMAGSVTLNVQYSYAAAGSNAVLTEGLPGHFVATVIPAGLASGDVFTVRYLDNNPGSGRPASVLSKAIAIP